MFPLPGPLHTWSLTAKVLQTKRKLWFCNLAINQKLLIYLSFLFKFSRIKLAHSVKMSKEIVTQSFDSTTMKLIFLTDIIFLTKCIFLSKKQMSGFFYYFRLTLNWFGSNHFTIIINESYGALVVTSNEIHQINPYILNLWNILMILNKCIIRWFSFNVVI